MQLRSSTLATAGSVVLLAALSGCALVTPAASTETPSPMAQCAQGKTWTLDTADLGAKLLAQTQRSIRGDIATVEVTGSKTIEWRADSTVTMTSDLTITMVTGGDNPVTVTQTQAGTATGTAYVQTDVAVPRKWKNDIAVQSAAEQGGAALDPVPFGPPNFALDDVVGWTMTCEGGAMTLTPRGGAITQNWTAG